MWWDGVPNERYWVEITRAEDTGKRLICPQQDEKGHPNWAYDLVATLTPGDIVYHWFVGEGRMLGRSTVEAPFFINSNGWREVPLRNFQPIGGVTTEQIRAKESALRQTKVDLQVRFPGASLYLPFQYSDKQPLRFMSNYFAKLPAADVTTLFGPSGINTWDDEVGVLDPAPDEATPLPPALGVSHRGFLQPFKPKSDERYRVIVRGGGRERSPAHETLVNRCAEWLSTKYDCEPGRNQAIDLGLAEPSVIIEAKTVQRSWALPIRAAVGQLYEYRYWQLVPPDSSLFFLADKPVPDEWITYLESDRGIGCVWPVGTGFDGSSRWQHLVQSLPHRS